MAGGSKACSGQQLWGARKKVEENGKEDRKHDGRIQNLSGVFTVAPKNRKKVVEMVKI